MANLLLLDDEQVLLEAMEELLTGVGHRVQATDSADDALAILDSSENDLPDLIISDVIMPTMNGLEFLKAVRARPGLEDEPFLFVSASTTLQMEKWLAEIDGVSFIRKPFDIQALFDAVTRILRDR